MSRLAFFRVGRTTSDFDGAAVVGESVSAGPGEGVLWRVVVGRDLPFFLMNGTVVSRVDAISYGFASLVTMSS